MSIDLVTKYLPYVDEIFSTEAKKALFTNTDYSWDGAHAIKLYKISTSEMNDYGRSGPDVLNWSRYGAVASLDATTETLTLSQDRSFTFAIDTLDSDETGNALEAASALARQLRTVVIPEIDNYVITKMILGAGTSATAKELTTSNIYTEIITGSKTLDEAEAPELGRVLLVNADTYMLLKQSEDIAMETNIGNDMRLRGVIGMVDGMPVIRVPAARVPETFGFALVHPCATVAPVKLASYRIHNNPPGISGSLVEGRIAYDTFVLDNKKDAIYYQPIPDSDEGTGNDT